MGLFPNWSSSCELMVDRGRREQSPHLSVRTVRPAKRRGASEARMAHWTDDRNLSVGQRRDGWAHTGKRGGTGLCWPGLLAICNRNRTGWDTSIVWISERRESARPAQQREGCGGGGGEVVGRRGGGLEDDKWHAALHPLCMMSPLLILSKGTTQRFTLHRGKIFHFELKEHTGQPPCVFKRLKQLALLNSRGSDWSADGTKDLSGQDRSLKLWKQTWSTAVRGWKLKTEYSSKQIVDWISRASWCVHLNYRNQVFSDSSSSSSCLWTCHSASSVVSLRPSGLVQRWWIVLAGISLMPFCPLLNIRDSVWLQLPSTLIEEERLFSGWVTKTTTPKHNDGRIIPLNHFCRLRTIKPNKQEA